MSGFDSPNFKKNIPTNQKPLREFTVGAPENQTVSQSNFGQYGPPPVREYPPQSQTFGTPPPQHDMSQGELEAAIREARAQKLANANKIGDEAKKRIELLANIGRLNRDVKIGGYTFSLRTLKSKESREAALATFATSVTQLEASYEARKQQLARAIFKIDGEDLEVVLGSRNIDDVMKFIEDNLEDIVVEKLWDEFISLKEESRSKYGINTVKQAEEVSEDLKK